MIGYVTNPLNFSVKNYTTSYYTTLVIHSVVDFRPLPPHTVHAFPLSHGASFDL